VEKGEVEETGEVGEDDSVIGVVKGVSTWRGDEVEEMELVIIGETGEDNLAKGEKNLFIEHHMSYISFKSQQLVILQCDRLGIELCHCLPIIDKNYGLSLVSCPFNYTS
jgi:hypothetical protein